MVATLQQIKNAVAYGFMFSNNTDGVVLLLENGITVAAWEDGNVYDIATLDQASQEQHVPSYTDQENMQKAINDFISYAKL